MKVLCFLLIVLALPSCSENCTKLPSIFSEYSEAIRMVEASKFSLKDDADCSESSWILDAKFYSCDKKFGFFIYSTGSKKYIHCDVPIQLWEGFKLAQSKGRFYHQNFDYRFRCEIM